MEYILQPMRNEAITDLQRGQLTMVLQGKTESKAIKTRFYYMV